MAKQSYSAEQIMNRLRESDVDFVKEMARAASAPQFIATEKSNLRCLGLVRRTRIEGAAPCYDGWQGATNIAPISRQKISRLCPNTDCPARPSMLPPSAATVFALTAATRRRGGKC